VKGRKKEVYQALLNAKGEYVGGPALSNVACGGSEGLRRLRQLRSEGYIIEKKKIDPKHNYFSYRLVTDG
jgi:biotin operon repressor